MSLASSPEYRRDPVTGRWVIIAPERAARPMALRHSRPHHRRDAGPEHCPFCEGREGHTPGEVYAIRSPGSRPDGPGWQLRVLNNLFPAVRPFRGAMPDGPGPWFESLPGYGRHEVVVESPRHESNPALLTDDEFQNILVAYRQRLIVLGSDPRIACVSVFKNVGAEAGASLPHSHSQLIATSIVPDAVRQERDGAADYHRRHGECVFCAMLNQELAANVRLVDESEQFVAFCPYASRFGYETWVLPRTHSSRYESLSDAHAAELAVMLRQILGRFDRVLESPAYNYYLHTGPPRAGEQPDYHWHLEILPITTRPAGFEWGSGCFINIVAPERAAADLRAARELP